MTRESLRRNSTNTYKPTPPTIEIERQARLLVTIDLMKTTHRVNGMAATMHFLLPEEM